MRLTMVFCLIGLMGAAAWGADTGAARNLQVEAAKADAMESLMRQILGARVSPELTVGALLDRVGGADELGASLARAEQLGEPRWLDEQTVQVRLTMDGTQVAKTLQRIVEKRAGKSPIKPAALRQLLRQWADRFFSADGVSMGAGDVVHLRPAESDAAWRQVSDAQRRAALIAARDHAVDRVMTSLGPVAMGNQTLGTALAQPGVLQAVRQWIAGRPVKTVEFADDGVVQLTLACSADDLWAMLRPALGRQDKVALPTTSAGWDGLEAAVKSHLAPAQGRGVAQAPSGPSTQATAPVMLPAVAPTWTSQEADAQATSPNLGGSRLHTARRAEAMALADLRQQVDELSLGAGLTLGSAARRDPHIEQAVARAMNRAKPYQVDYGAKGAVTVHVTLHLADLWTELSGQE